MLRRVEMRLRGSSAPDHYIFESEAMRRTATHGRGIPHDRTSVIYNGVDADRFRPQADAAAFVRREFGFSEDDCIVVYMGHVHERKGFHILAAAMHRLFEDGAQNLKLLVLGNRGEEAERFSATLGRSCAARCFRRIPKRRRQAGRRLRSRVPADDGMGFLSPVTARNPGLWRSHDRQRLRRPAGGG